MLQRDEMDAGSVLRIALVQSLMGGFTVEPVEFLDKPGVVFLRNGARVLRGETGQEPMKYDPRYALSYTEWEPDIDLMDAFDVVAELRRQGYQFTLADLNRKHYAAFVKGPRRFESTADRDELAICRAALKAAQQVWTDQQAGREARYARA